ncbi:NADH-quinone oxidoreductase subunit NuoF [Candidatus Brocadia pituitae]|nr:NADH-quinone oxidoreductase subunit NuoF [Candidatus Brocadia pituitae]
MERPLTQYIQANKPPMNLSEYEKVGGYKALHKALKEMKPQEVQKLVLDSNLKGRGGAGFSTGTKWSLIPMGENAPAEKYFICNADEMEPGTFKDRLLLEGNPHQLIEGIIISAYAIQANKGFIFLRWAYKKAADVILKSISEAYSAGYIGNNILGTGFNFNLYLHRSVGRYICGEETALLNALEGKRAIPRAKPPYPNISGLFGKPTTMNSVETLSFIPHIVNNGATWFKDLSITGEGGTKIYGVSGKVKNPGAWELPLGTTIREIIFEHAGGMKNGFTLKGFLPGGASTDFLTEEHLDVNMDYASLGKVGSRLGTGTMIILDDKTCPVGMVHNLEHFFAQESCGWCTPCREGLPWVEKILFSLEEGTGRMEDIDLLLFHAKHLAPGRTFCALAPGAVEPLQSSLKYFRDDYIKHIHDKRCPWR